VINRINVFLVFLIFSMAIFSCKPDDKNIPKPNIDCNTIPFNFETEIKPIIDSKCGTSGCHASGSANGNYSTYSGIKEKVKSGAFYDRVIKEKDMPPSGPLSKDELNKLECWIDAGYPEK
jgi:hypothetical protein